MKIAIPITAESMDAALRDIDLASGFADIIELRLDYIQNPDVERLLGHSPLPKIVTNRTSLEGGRFWGSEQKRVSYLESAISLGAEYVDIELNHYHPLERGKTKLIVSHHNFEKTPSNLREIYQKIAAKNPDIVKIATKANNPLDSFRMLGLIAEADRDMIGICMGKEGLITRVYGPLFGSYLTFASLENGKASAPGQLSFEELKQVWKTLQIG